MKAVKNNSVAKSQENKQIGMSTLRNIGDKINKFVRLLSWGMVQQRDNARGSHEAVVRALDTVVPWFRAHYGAATGTPLTDNGFRNLVATRKERYPLWPRCQRVPAEWYDILPTFLPKPRISGRDIAEAIGIYPAYTHDCAEFGRDHKWQSNGSAQAACIRCAVTGHAEPTDIPETDGAEPSGAPTTPGVTSAPVNPTERLLYFIREREAIRLKREAGLPFPWTDDHILRDYRFCNIEREKDAVTKGITALYREPHQGDPDLWFALLVARRAVNWPATLEEIGYPVPWDPEKFKSVIRVRQTAGLKAFEAQAYKVIVSGKSGEQADLIVDHVLNPMWEQRDRYHPRLDDTLSSFAARLSDGPYMGGFYAGQVVADLKYAQLKFASDWWTFAVSGPGSRRGLDRVKGRTPRKYWDEAEWYAEFSQLYQAMKGPIFCATRLTLHAADFQSCLCEYDKYCRLLNNEGNNTVRRYVAPTDQFTK